MGTVIEQVSLTDGGWRTHHSALRLAVNAAKHCLHEAGRNAHDVDLLINAGIYRDRNLAEPALAAMIQEDIGANPEDPHEQAHGTFSFDVSNGSCGVLTALQIVDGFLKSRAIDLALVVASDADPGHGLSEDFPFSPAGTALFCDWSDDARGLERIHWINIPDEGESFSATVGLLDGRNVLRFAESEKADELFAAAAAQADEHAFTHRRGRSTTSSVRGGTRTQWVPSRAFRAYGVLRNPDHRRRRPANAHRLVGGGIRPCECSDPAGLTGPRELVLGQPTGVRPGRPRSSRRRWSRYHCRSRAVSNAGRNGLTSTADSF